VLCLVLARYVQAVEAGYVAASLVKVRCVTLW
jgi:hypothetical protein